MPASAQEPLPVYAGSLDFPSIDSAAAPEEYSWRVELGPGETLLRLSETEAEITRPGVEEMIYVPDAYDLHGTPVPTSLAVAGDVVTLTVHHREDAFVYPVSTITPEERDTAPLREYDSWAFPLITGPESPENYPLLINLGEEQRLDQVSPTEVEVVYPGHMPAFTILAQKAHDAVGATVPTSLKQTGRDEVTLTVHHRAGDPATGAPFVYPISGGEGWEGGFTTTVVEMKNPQAPVPAPGAPPVPAPACTVPSLRGLRLRAAKAKLRDAHCRIGAIHLAARATLGKGKVVKQFHAAGSELAARAPVAVKLGAR